MIALFIDWCLEAVGGSANLSFWPNHHFIGWLVGFFITMFVVMTIKFSVFAHRMKKADAEKYKSLK
ncbi:hypothetical protein [Klebsiella variicola]|uniref:hypothetical protein n=1 Tax=Klebsiella variicola TaxID=244366 RepID=UPI0034DFDEBD